MSTDYYVTEYEPGPLWHREVGASERRVKELLSVHQPIVVFFDEAEKLLRKDPPKPRKTYPNNKMFRTMGLSPR